jgi:hypothetical protein
MSNDTNIGGFKEKVSIKPYKVPHSSWESKVYHLPEENNGEVEFKAISKVIKKRDKYSCKSCRIKIGLTVHHIIPRNEGGTNYPPNLITLCENCHNEIEILGLRHKEEIEDYKYNRKYIKRDKTIVTNEVPTHWEQWVYGGYRRPSN